jgi:peroxiredoxin
MPLRPIYETWGIDIPDHNGDSSFQLPIPATFIVDTNGKILHAHVDMNYTQRLEPDIIIEQLRSI